MQMTLLFIASLFIVGAHAAPATGVTQVEYVAQPQYGYLGQMLMVPAASQTIENVRYAPQEYSAGQATYQSHAPSSPIYSPQPAVPYIAVRSYEAAPTYETSVQEVYSAPKTRTTQVTQQTEVPFLRKEVVKSEHRAYVQPELRASVYPAPVSTVSHVAPSVVSRVESPAISQVETPLVSQPVTSVVSHVESPASYFESSPVVSHLATRTSIQEPHQVYQYPIAASSQPAYYGQYYQSPAYRSFYTGNYPYSSNYYSYPYLYGQATYY